MENKIVDTNQPVLKNDKGIFVPPETIDAKIRQESSDAVKKYNEKYNKALNAPTPKVRLPYNAILTTAVPVKMQEFSQSGLIITNTMDIDPREAQRLSKMSENVWNEQKVLLKGGYVLDEIVKTGETVKLDFSRYRSLNDDHAAGVIETGYNIPLYNIDGNDYLLLDARDIVYIREE